MLKKYTVHVGDNNLHNVHKLIILTNKETTKEEILEALHESRPNEQVINVSEELLLNKGYLINEEFVGKYTPS